MDFPFVLLVLVALPFAAAGLILAVSIARRRGGGPVPEERTEPVHRLQSGTAADQDAVIHPRAGAPKAVAARDRRAASAARPQDE